MIVDHPDRARELGIRARAAMGRGDFKAALTIYDELVAANPDEPRWRRRRLEAVRTAVLASTDPIRRFDECIRRLELVAAETPSDPMSRFELGYGYLVMTSENDLPSPRAVAAMREFAATRQLAPACLAGWWGLIAVAELGYRLDTSEQSTPAFLARQAVAEMPTESRAHLLFAMTLLSSGRIQFAQGVASLRTAIDLDPYNQEALLLYGDAMVCSGQSAAAIVAYQRAISVEPASWLADASRSQIARLTGPPPRDDRTASGIPFRCDEPPDPDPAGPNGGRMPIPPWVPAFRSWPQFTGTEGCRVLFFESAW